MVNWGRWWKCSCYFSNLLPRGQPPGGDVSGLLAFFSSIMIIFPLSPQHTPRQANLPFPVSLTFPMQSRFFLPKQKSNWIVRPLVKQRMSLFIPKPRRSQLSHKGTEGNATPSLILPRILREPFWSLQKTPVEAWSVAGVLLPLWMKNFYLLGGGPENRTVLVLFTQ